MVKYEVLSPEKKVQQIHHVRCCHECGGTGTGSICFKGDTITMNAGIEFVDCYYCNGEGYIDWVQHLIIPNHIQLYHGK